VLVDGNLRFGVLDTMLNLQVTRTVADLLPSLDSAEPELLHSATLPHNTGVRLLAAPPRPEEADLLSVEQVKQITALAQQRFDYAVVDLGSNLDDRALSFMDAADCIFVLLTPDIPAVKNVRLFIEVAQGLGYEQEKILLVLNRANPRSGINADAIQRHLKLPIVANIPDSPRLTQVAINRGVPLILYEREVNKEMPLTRQILVLAEMVPQPGESLVESAEIDKDGREGERELEVSRASQQRKGFLSRFLGRSD
jgi:pilus assembly protein CpaE